MTSIRERNKELILRAASEEFADKGFAASKTSDIAAKAGLPKPNVYYYFKSKENLYREVLESIIEPLLAASRRDALSTVTGLLDAGARRLVDVLAALDPRILGRDAVAAVDPDGAALHDVDVPEDLPEPSEEPS